MLCALEDLGFAGAFDAVYAASSGAVNSAYFLAGGSWCALSIYHDELATRRFVDFRRFWRGRILDLDYAFDVVDRKKPLDYDAVLGSPIPLYVAVTLVDEIRTEIVGRYRSPGDLRIALRASAWLPFVLRGTADFHGRRAVDGGVLMPHPYRIALDHNCTHVLSLSTRPIRLQKSQLLLSEECASRYLDNIRLGLGRGYRQARRSYRSERSMLQRRMVEPGERPYVLDLAPLPWMAEIKRHEVDPGRIIGGARGAYEVTYCALARVWPATMRRCWQVRWRGQGSSARNSRRRRLRSEPG
jgi:predicted patatin/cPLA2 family phospholipase